MVMVLKEYLELGYTHATLMRASSRQDKHMQQTASTSDESIKYMSPAQTSLNRIATSVSLKEAHMQLIVRIATVSMSLAQIGLRRSANLVSLGDTHMSPAQKDLTSTAILASLEETHMQQTVSVVPESMSPAQIGLSRTAN